MLQGSTEIRLPPSQRGQYREIFRTKVCNFSGPKRISPIWEERLIIRRYRLSAIRSISDPAAPVQRHLRQARQLDSESTSGGNGHMIRNSPEIIWMRRQISLPAKFVSGGFLLGAACRRSVPNANRQSPRITQPVRSPDAIWRASRQKFAMLRSPINP
jgi:hypothetical protein